MKYLPLLLCIAIMSCQTKVPKATTDKMAASTKKPNVIFILADDLGYGDLSCFGADSIQTPNIDKLAAEGVKLTSHYCPYPVCTPNRASLMTGQYPERCNMTHIEASWIKKG